jgi:DNA-binding Lrp family transcriptional regulator
MTSAFLLINCTLPFVDDVISELKKISEIDDVYKVHGHYDIIVKISTGTEEQLQDIIKNKVRKIDKITLTITVIIVKQ